MEVTKYKCDNCNKERETLEDFPGWLTINVKSFYTYTKAMIVFSKPYIDIETRLDFCCEQCFLSYFINLINLNKGEQND